MSRKTAIGALRNALGATPGFVTAVLNAAPRRRPRLVLPGRQWLPAAVA